MNRWARDVFWIIFASQLVLTPAGCTIALSQTAKRLIGDAMHEQVTGTDLPNLQTAIARHHLAHGSLPQTGALEALVAEGYLVDVPFDPWDRAYLFERQGPLVRLATLGRDGRAGGGGPDADLELWIAD